MWNWDNVLKDYVTELTEPVDCIIPGRVLAQGFIPTWASRVTNPETADQFAHKMVDTPKIVFTKTLNNADPEVIGWNNTSLAKGNIIEEITQLKNQPGNDIIVYGGHDFVSNLIQHSLIDEYHLFVNPVVIGNGMSIWKDIKNRINLKLIKTTISSTGIVILSYLPAGVQAAV